MVIKMQFKIYFLSVNIYLNKLKIDKETFTKVAILAKLSCIFVTKIGCIFCNDFSKQNNNKNFKKSSQNLLPLQNTAVLL